MPVDKYLDMDTAFWGSVRETNEGLKIGGKQHIMMTSSQPWCHVIYKKDLFTSKKMEDPSSLLFKNKWTWDKLEEYAKALTRPNASDPSKSIYGLHVSSGGNFAATVGKDFCEYDTVNKKWVSNLRDPKVTEAMNFLASLGPMGKKYAPVDIDINEALQMFRTDRIGMLLTHDSIGLHFTDPKEAEMLMSVPYPRYPRSSTYYYPAQITAWGIPQGAKNPVGALALVFTSRALHLQIDTKAIDFGKYETTESKYMYDVQNYFETIATPVVMHTRRLVNLYPVQEGFWTPGFYEGTSWSVTVAQQEPIMLEELKKY